jgi:hypothetical protein
MAEDRLYLTVDDHKRQPQNDGYIAVISRGHPKAGDQNSTVLMVKVVKNAQEAKAWFKRMEIERPWEDPIMP